MTDREKAIVMAHTGICMLTGDKFQIFHKYVEDIMGRPIMTHEIGWLADAIKEKSKADFMALCADESSSGNPTEWIPVSERLPEDGTWNLFTDGNMVSVERYKADAIDHFYPIGRWFSLDEAIAWMPLPEPYQTESEEEE